MIYFSAFEMARHLTRDAFPDDYFELCWSSHLHQKISFASSTAPAGDVAFYCERRSEFSKDPQLRHAAAFERSSCERSSCSRQLVAVEAPHDTGCGSFLPFLPYIALCLVTRSPYLFVCPLVKTSIIDRCRSHSHARTYSRASYTTCNLEKFPSLSCWQFSSFPNFLPVRLVSSKVVNIA